MQGRFPSLRVTETWEMVRLRSATATTPPVPTLLAREVDPRPADQRPRALDPAARRTPSGVN